MVQPGDPVERAVQAAFGGQTRALVAQAPRAFLGDPDGVHRMRVRQRHLRSIVRSFAPILDSERLVTVGKDLSQLGLFLGAVRDLDVFRDRVCENASGQDVGDPLLQVIDARVSAARDRLRSALMSPRYRGLIRAARAAEADSELVVTAGTCEQELPPLAWKAAARLRREGRKLTSRSPEHDFHQVRKLAKRARYTAESVADFVSRERRSELSRFASRLTEVQNAFGQHQDATEARSKFVEISQADFSKDGAMSLRIGRLIEQADRDAIKLRRKCLRAWDKLERELGNTWLRT
jgi:CHAD domain-containing protein